MAPISHPFSAASLLIASTLALAPVGPLAASPPACTCHNIESLQEDLQNAVYLEQFMRDLAADLAAVEAHQTDLNQNHPTDPDSGRDVKSVAYQERQSYFAAHFHPPFPRIKDYTGPDSIEMDRGACTQPQAALDAMENGSPCEAMADAALAHELAHRDLCNMIGASAYWDRPLSAMALEEAQAYHRQAGNLRSELRRVLEISDITFSSRFAPTIVVPKGMTASYLYQLDSSDIGNAQGGDRWTMTGNGTQSAQITAVSIAGRACKPGGALRANITLRMTTDGLTFDLDQNGKSAGGQVTIVCFGGYGMSLPVTDVWSGMAMSNKPVKEGETRITTDGTVVLRQMLASVGGTASGDYEETLTISCKGP